MSDSSDRKPNLPPGGFSLGGLGQNDYDTSLTPGEPADPDALILPRDALLAFRKSGGLRFTSRGLVIYRNGWVVPLSGETKPRHLNDDAYNLIAKLTLRSGLARIGTAGAAQPPDSYAYELVARIGRNERKIEVFDGGIPQELAPLIKVLNKLLRRVFA